ncbi:MAG: phosphatase PAP2 family protein [Gemmatimonadota bacterium]
MAQPGWTLIKIAKRLNTKFEKDWRAIPAAERSAWARDILLGLGAVVLALFLSMRLLDVTTGTARHFPWEARVLHAIDRGPISFSSAVWLQTFGTDFMLLFVMITTWALAVWKDRPLLAVTILLSVIVMDAIVRIGWFALDRSRPDIIAQGLAAPGFHSFPSGHTSKTLAFYGLIITQWAKASSSSTERLFALLVAAFICIGVAFARLRMGAHWPTDILGGWLLGGIWLAFMLRALRHERYARER